MPRGKAQSDQFARIARHYDALMSLVPYGAWAQYVSDLALLAHHPITEGSRLLDLATGTGSVALEFAARGCCVTGVDLSEPMLEQARAKAAARALCVEFLQGDLARFTLPAEFDHAICLYDSLNYLLASAQLKQAFANIRAALKTGGLLIFDVNTVHALEAELFTQRSGPNSGIRYDWISEYHPKTRTTVVKMHFEIPETDEIIDVEHVQRGYTDAEIRAFLHAASFISVQSYDAYRLSAPTVTSDRVFYVATAS